MANAGFKDLFSNHAGDYAQFRPRYPRALFEYLASISPRKDRAWDCGTGSGQAAVGLAEFFKEVIATDPSDGQLANAEPHSGVRYRQAPAESSGLEAASVDLVTVAQAFHWFKHESFFAEFRRVARPGAHLAVWSYNLFQSIPEIDGIVDHLCNETLGERYWEPERKLVDTGYRTISVPFKELQVPTFEMKAQWSFDHMTGYLNTWSALQKYMRVNGANPLEPVCESLKNAWGDVPTREIRWRLSLRVFRFVHQ